MCAFFCAKDDLSMGKAWFLRSISNMIIGRITNEVFRFQPRYPNRLCTEISLKDFSMNSLQRICP